MSSPDVIIIGAGPSGISMAYTIKHKLGYSDFTIYEKLDGVGGTWRTNTYPGIGCDVPTILYSFHFNINPNWSKELCEGAEILEYIESTVDKFSLRDHMHFSIECLGASWNKETNKWDVKFRDCKTGLEFVRSAAVFISAVGGISYPRDVKFPGMEKFQGAMFHTAKWDHSYNYKGKRLAVIGNGCSAAQVVPAIINDAASVKQYARSAQWYHERPNRNFTKTETWAFRYIPGWERLRRLQIFLENDELVATYMPGANATKKRKLVEDHSKNYICSRAPEKYHQVLVPDFPLGCKRRIFDPNYLDALNEPNMELISEGIQEIDETGLVSTSGRREEFDAIILATGFQVQQFLTPMEVYGKGGKSLNQQWKEHRGAQAYMGSFVHNFPNFAILFGPNTFPAHNSALFTCEVQVDFVARNLLAPLIDHKASILEVKASKESQWVNDIHRQLQGSVFAAGCTNWYINEHGRNAASWPGYASTYWKEASIPRFGIFNKQGDAVGAAKRPVQYRPISSSIPKRNESSPPSQSPAFKSNTTSAKDTRSLSERMSLKGKTTIITGGARGIGLSLVEAVADAGGDVAILDVLEQPKIDLSTLGVNARYYRTDVTKQNSLEDTFGRIGKDFGRIDNCVTAAGIVADKPFFDHQWDECERLLKVNVLGTFFCAQLAAKAIRDQGTGGSLVMIASIASYMSLPLQHLPFYGATKGAVRIMTKQLAVELAPLNIRVNSISPGFIRTDMTELCAVQQPELYSVFNSAPPIGRIGETTDITGAVNYLLSDAAAYTTGIDIPITGGLIAGRITH
ncbi:NAD(P)-binding protein [Aaosphaeria arxii CBS 175.79]|uniref:NAD(P)-binding protein n=1 Tax=Aaosphaeria arxii CBS 175.79 TaxID=1450172 RepID=A0A6A5XAE6_9PLEO|nr:NAD(P)-binding protein [Aaosphaeria arxii CBS 175.79]KAF2009747.1 NAD(P)-binding protein [Aaosphaeria arxii CBS 175.79]